MSPSHSFTRIRPENELVWRFGLCKDHGTTRRLSHHTAYICKQTLSKSKHSLVVVGPIVSSSYTIAWCPCLQPWLTLFKVPVFSERTARIRTASAATWTGGPGACRAASPAGGIRDSYAQTTHTQFPFLDAKWENTFCCGLSRLTSDGRKIQLPCQLAETWERWAWRQGSPSHMSTRAWHDVRGSARRLWTSPTACPCAGQAC